MRRRRCPGCLAPLGEPKPFCPTCGYELDDRQREPDRSAILAVALVFVGVLVSLVLSARLFGDPWPTDASVVSQALAMNLGFVLVGVLALGALGRGALRESFAGAGSAKSLGLGVSVGAGGFLVSTLWVLALVQLSAAPGLNAELPVEFAPSLGVLLLTSVVLPALIEEWTDRGVLWVALRRVATPGVTIFSTALLFGFSHGLNGGNLLEVPHRFAVGLLLGWLRHRTGSLLPCVLAHATLNSLAVFV